MPLSFKLKKSVTLVLIGDHQSGKKELLSLLHAALSGKNQAQFFAMEDTLPTPDVDSNGSRYTVDVTPDGPKVQIIDTPELDKDDPIVDKITQAVKDLPTVDAFIIVVDVTTTKLGEGITRTLDKLDTIFPRPIKENLCYLLTSRDNGKKPVERPKPDDLPQVQDQAQIVGPITNMVEIRKSVRSLDSEEKKEAAIKEVESAFDNSLKCLQDLSSYVDQCSIQAYEMKHLYLRATGIESTICQIVRPKFGNPASGDDNIIGRLVDEYKLLAASPDFITQLELLIELFRGRDIMPSIQNKVDELEKHHAKLQGLKSNSSKYPEGYIV